MESDIALSDVAMRPDVKIFFGGKPHNLHEPRPSPDPNACSPIPPSSFPIARRIVPQVAVALGGLAGNNAHGAGFLEALRRTGIMPQIISCTSGQLRSVEVFLKGDDILKWFEQRLAETQPYFASTDANLLYKMTLGQMEPIRLSVPEFPYDLVTTLQRYWLNFWSNPWNFSFFRELWNIWPARSLVCQDSDAIYEGLAKTFTDEKQVGVIFNAYEFSTGTEVVYMNDRAFELTGKSFGINENRRWVRYAQIDPSAVRDALRLFEYGFSDGCKMLDGAYCRDIILSEIPDRKNAVEQIAVARPQADKWLGPAPLSWTELRDMQTEVNFNGTYIGERERIRLLNRLPGQRQILIFELPLDRQRGWWDYVLEDICVFRSAFWRGLELAKSLS